MFGLALYGDNAKAGLRLVSMSFVVSIIVLPLLLLWYYIEEVDGVLGD